jgi:hypothetical protein
MLEVAITNISKAAKEMGCNQSAKTTCMEVNKGLTYSIMHKVGEQNLKG